MRLYKIHAAKAARVFALISLTSGAKNGPVDPVIFRMLDSLAFVSDGLIFGGVWIARFGFFQ
jgi:hypothetical protein